MKKIYSFLMLLIMTAFSVAASAKTFTITVDDQTHIGYAMLTSEYRHLTFSDNMVEFEAETTDYIVIKAATGWQIESAVDGEGNSLAYAPAPDVSFPLSALGEGSEIKVATSEKEPKIFTFTGDERLKVVMYTSETGDVQYTAENGVFTVPMPDNDYNAVNISSDIETLAIRKVVADNGNEHYPNSGTVEVYPFAYEGSMHFTIETYNPEEVRTASMTVKVNGNADIINFQRSDYTYVTLNSDGETTVKFDPENEASFIISSTNYSKPLYQVKHNGELLTASYGTFYVTANDGDNVEITPNFPDVDVPVTFTFTNEGTEDAISYFAVDNQYDIDWKQENFSVKLGSCIDVKLNNDDYDITEWKINDEIQPSYSSYYNGTVTSEDPLNFVITATKKAPKNITVHCEQYEKVVVYALNQYYSQFESYELTDKDTQIEVSAAASYIQVKAVEDWIISYIEDSDGIEYTADSYIPVSDGMELFVGANALERDRNLTVYVGGEETDWSYYGITISGDNWDLRKEYTSYEGTLTLGYNNILFGDFDCPIQVSGYTSPDYNMPFIYLNDQRCPFSEDTYRYEGLDGELQDGDVLKLFVAEPETYTVTYSIDNANVEVVHDHARTVEIPSTHTVLEGTEVWIKSEDATEIVVTVNENEITADENGVYAFTVNENTSVKVAANIADAILDIENKSAENADVYNLQGIRVGTVKDATRLPAGVYIVNGKKVRF